MKGTFILYTDGASRGNPGPASCGVVLFDPYGELLIEFGRYLGHRTNNTAEYRGLILGLSTAAGAGIQNLKVRLDSELLVKQMTGQARRRMPHIKDLYEEAQAIAAQFQTIEFVHIPRGQNARADAQANKALDERKKK